MPLYYLGPYVSQIKPEYVRWKNRCNFLLGLTILALLLNIVFGVLMI
jgi:hypothetical protein